MGSDPSPFCLAECGHDYKWRKAKGGFLTMGSRRIGLARFEALLENLRRSLDLNGLTMDSLTLTNSTITDASYTPKSYEINNSSAAQEIVITTSSTTTGSEVQYIAGSSIYVEAGGANKDIDITLPENVAGRRYTFICTGAAGSGTHVALSSSVSKTLAAAIVCEEDGAYATLASNTGQTVLKFDDQKFNQLTRLVCEADGNNWYVHGLTTVGSGNLGFSQS
jgi:hypothetical protein